MYGSPTCFGITLPSSGSVLVPSVRCLIEEQSIEYCGWACWFMTIWDRHAPTHLETPAWKVPRSGKEEEPWRCITSKSSLACPCPLAFHIYEWQKINTYWHSNGPVYYSISVAAIFVCCSHFLCYFLSVCSEHDGKVRLVFVFLCLFVYWFVMLS
jgi:hypothetical protein